MSADVDAESFDLTFDDSKLKKGCPQHGGGLTKVVALPADYAVWLASSESNVVGSGRLLWAHWLVRSATTSWCSGLEIKHDVRL